MANDGGYLLDNQQAEAGSRFDALATLFNPSTYRHIDALGIAEGWRCWEVGAGSPSVPSWLAARVGPAGHVLATDIDVSWMTAAAYGGYEVRRHDVGIEPPPGNAFDLVHARLVLVHVPQRAAALSAMISALRPSGWLLVEEADPMMQPLVCPDESGPPQRLANKLKRDFRTLMVQRGVDLSYGRTLPRLLRDAGLVDVEADAFFPMTGAACTLLERATVAQIRDRLVAANLATTQEVDQHLHNVASGLLDLATSPMISAVGPETRLNRSQLRTTVHRHCCGHRTPYFSPDAVVLGSDRSPARRARLDIWPLSYGWYRFRRRSLRRAAHAAVARPARPAARL